MPSSPSTTEPLRDLIDESFDEATFLWRRWESELTSLTRNLDEVWSWTEDRLHGALDGVRVGGDAAIELATSALKSEEPDQIAVGAGVLSCRSEVPAIEALTEAIGAAEGDALHAMVRGLELMGSNQALRAAAAALAAGGPTHAGALCRLKAFRRAPLGAEARAAFGAKSVQAQAEAFRAVFYTASGQFDKEIEAGMVSPDAQVRCAAIEAGVSRGMASAQGAAVQLARTSGASAGPYLRLLPLFGSEDEQEVIYAALRNPTHQKDAIWALGHLGTIRAAEACLAGMRHEPLARACGEAYCWITGADLVRDRLAKVEAPEDAPAFEEDDLEADLVPTVDELWPMPDADAAAKHWETRRSEFAPDIRYAQGRPISLDQLMTLVETGPMLRRPDLVLELRARTRGAYDVETRAFSARQRQMMAAARAAAMTNGGR